MANQPIDLSVNRRQKPWEISVRGALLSRRQRKAAFLGPCVQRLQNGRWLKKARCHPVVAGKIFSVKNLGHAADFPSG